MAATDITNGRDGGRRVADVETDLSLAVDAARAAAEVIREGFHHTTAVSMKGEVDPVTAVDEEAERAIFEVLTRARPGDALLGEESGGSDWRSGRVWIVDPLDGTVNFVHGIPHVSVSVALWIDGAPSDAVVVDVTREEEFTASAGDGARLNGRTMRVSECGRLDDAMVATGFPYDRRRHARTYADLVARVLERSQGIRRIGSAALDMAWVACGRFDAYWEFGLKPWDSAAGALLVTEAGGRVGGTGGTPHAPGDPVVVAAPETIFDDLVHLVAASLPEHLR